MVCLTVSRRFAVLCRPGEQTAPKECLIGDFLRVSDEREVLRKNRAGVNKHNLFTDAAGSLFDRTDFPRDSADIYFSSIHTAPDLSF